MQCEWNRLALNPRRSFVAEVGTGFAELRMEPERLKRDVIVVIVSVGDRRRHVAVFVYGTGRKRVGPRNSM